MDIDPHPTAGAVPPAYSRILSAGEAAFTVEFGSTVDADLNRRVHALDAALRARPIPGVIECVPTYRSLLVRFDLLTVDGESVLLQLQARLVELSTAQTFADAAPESGRIVEIPVQYGGEFGPDLADVAAHCGLAAAEVVRRHAEPLYQVAMLGFAPGFAYLLNLPEALATPRLATPRLRVAPGSVGIAGNQTGVYALETPGGWRIIGRTSLLLFDGSRHDPFLVKAGDRVRFVPVSQEDYVGGP